MIAAATKSVAMTHQLRVRAFSSAIPFTLVVRSRMKKSSVAKTRIPRMIPITSSRSGGTFNMFSIVEGPPQAVDGTERDQRDHNPRHPKVVGGQVEAARRQDPIKSEHQRAVALAHRAIVTTFPADHLAHEAG